MGVAITMAARTTSTVVMGTRVQGRGWRDETLLEVVGLEVVPPLGPLDHLHTTTSIYGGGGGGGGGQFDRLHGGGVEVVGGGGGGH